MKYFICLMVIMFSGSVFAQDYFVIIKKNDDITYNYPQNVTMTLYDALGNATTIKDNDAIDVSGDFTLKIDVPWSNEQDIINSDGGQLEIFKLPTDIRSKDNLSPTHEVKVVNSDIDHSTKPTLERREVFKSEINPDEYNLLVTFNNSLTVRVFDGQARAWLDNEEIKVENRYLVQTEEGLLKLSFNEKTGETWWVWEL